MKKNLITALIFLQGVIYAQEMPVDSTKIQRFKIEIGAFIPLSNLKSQIGISQQFSFWYRTKIEHNDLMDLGFSIIVPKVANSFTYKANDSIYNVKAKGISIMIGCKINKIYPINIFDKKANIEWSSSIGGSFFSFEDKENPENTSGSYTDENGNRVYEIDTNTKYLNCLYLAQGIGLTSKNLGIQITYNYTPYSLFSNRIEPNFGHSSILIGIIYKQ